MAAQAEGNALQGKTPWWRAEMPLVRTVMVPARPFYQAVSPEHNSATLMTLG